MRKPQYYLQILIVLCVCLTYKANAQKCPSTKQLKTLLPGKWKLKTLWAPNFETMDEEENYYPVDKDNIDKFQLEEQSMEQSRYTGDFGLVSIEFMENGTFKAQHYDGRELTGEWNYEVVKKRKWVLFNVTYKAPTEYNNVEYDHSQEFQQIEFKANELIAKGDTCNDSCILKAVFEKVN